MGHWNWGWRGMYGLYEADATLVTDAHRMADEVVRDPTSVEIMRDRILDGTIKAPERAVLRGALDKVEAPLVGRPAADAWVGRAIGGRRE